MAGDNPFIPDWLEGPLEDWLGFEIPDFGLSPEDVRPRQVGPVPKHGARTSGVAGTPPSTASRVDPRTGCVITLPLEVVARAKCPRGYVAVNDPETGARVCMLKGAARSCGLWKAPKKPPISTRDWDALKRASSTIKKVDRVVRMSNEIQGKAKLTRSRSSR